MLNTDEENRKEFLELMTKVKDSCLKEIDEVYSEAEKEIDNFLKNKKEQIKNNNERIQS